MKYRAAFLVIIVMMAACGGTSSSVSPSADPQSTPAFSKDAYDISCADYILGMAAADRIFRKDQVPSPDELATMQPCRADATAPTADDPDPRSSSSYAEYEST